MNRIVGGLMILGGLLPGCRISNVGKDQPTEGTQASADTTKTQSKPVVQPQQQAQGVFSQTSAVTLGDDGKIEEKITIRLDYFATPKPGGVTVPSCYDALAGNMVIGRLVCGANEALAMDIQVNQLDQVCHTDNAGPTVAAKSTLQLVGCKGPSTMQVYKFSPEVKMDIVKP